MTEINTMKKTLLLILLLSVKLNAAPLEVLHWWTAPGELKSQQILDNALQRKNVELQNFAIIGGGGEGALRVLQMRALSGNPPDAAQIKGPDIGEWANVGMIEPVNKIVDTAPWLKILPRVVRDTVTFNGYYMAVPINIHRVNWLWLNKRIFTELKLPVPTTWDSFFKTADKIKAAGYLPLAYGSTAWQDALLFDSMALSLLGAEKYKKVFVVHDEKTLNSPEMVALFKKFKRLNDYVDKKSVGKGWSDASKLLVRNQAAMQFMGDWAKGVFDASGMSAAVDYMCVDVPESNGLFSYNIDSFVFFEKYSAKAHNNVQSTFVETLLSKQFQIDFNRSKGSIPVRNDIDMSMFDACSQKSYRDFNDAQLVPSFSQNMATSSNLQNIMTQIISNYFNDPNADAVKTVKRFSLAIRALN